MSTALDREEPILSVDKLKSRYLFGAKFTDDDGNELPNETFEFAIQTAISWLEHELDLTITPRTYVERRDFNRTDYYHWGYLRLYHYPLLSVESWKAQYPLNTDLIEYPSEWIRTYRETGEVQLVPTAGTIATFFLPQGGVLPYVLGKQDIPQFFEFEYTAGFEADCIPFAINNLIGLKAAIDIFNILGNLVIGAGIAASSLSIDGLSQSISTTASAENHAYSANVDRYSKQLERDIETVRRYYKGIQMAVI